MAEEVERLALHGLSLGAWQRFSDAGFRHYEVVEPGYKYNMTDLQAALGLHQLPRLDGWIERRAELWERYDELLAGLPLSTPPPPPSPARATRVTSTRCSSTPDAPAAHATSCSTRSPSGGSAPGCTTAAVHLHPYYRDRYAAGSPEQFPVANGDVASER